MTPNKSAGSVVLGKQPDKAASSAERRRDARAQLRRDVINAIGAEPDASTAALLLLLRSDLRTLDTKSRSSQQQSAARSSARRIVAELVRRYGIRF